MKSIRYTCPGIGCYNIEEPQIQKPDDIKIRIAFASICGSDIHTLKGEMDEAWGFKKGALNPMGHEASGVVAEVGPEAKIKGLKAGDKVIYYYDEYCEKCYFCRNGQEQFCLNVKIKDDAMQEFIVISENQVFKLPEDADLAKACMVEPISVCLHGIDRCNIRPGYKTAISGGGSIGLVMLQLAKMSGACRLTLIEPVKEKRDLAKKFGAEHVIDPFKQDVIEECKKITGGLGYDVVIETSGVPGACQASYDILSRGGLLEFFAIYANYKFPVDLMDMYFKEATITTVFESPYTFPRAIELLNRINLDDFIKNIFPPEKCKEAFDLQMTGKPVKVIFKF